MHFRSRSAYLLMYRKRRSDPESKEEALNSEDEVKETQMEAHRKREDEAQDFSCTVLEKMTEHGKDTIAFPSSKSHGRMNGQLNADNFLTEYQKSFSNQQVIHKKGANRVGTSKGQKSLYASDYRPDKYSQRSRKRADHTRVLTNISFASTKPPVWR